MWCLSTASLHRMEAIYRSDKDEETNRANVAETALLRDEDQIVKVEVRIEDWRWRLFYIE